MLPNHPVKMQLYIYNYKFTLWAILKFKVAWQFISERLTLHEISNHLFLYSNTVDSYLY